MLTFWIGYGHYLKLKNLEPSVAGPNVDVNPTKRPQIDVNLDQIASINDDSVASARVSTQPIARFRAGSLTE